MKSNAVFARSLTHSFALLVSDSLYIMETNSQESYLLQEEYVAGDEVGRLRCEHSYHAVCVNQWLRLKNWCPICKAAASTAAAAAAPSPSPPSPFST